MGRARIQGCQRWKDAGKLQWIASIQTTDTEAQVGEGTSQFRMEGSARRAARIERARGHHTVMKARVRSLFSTDIDSPLSAYVPPDSGHFALLVRAMVGPDEGPGEESFDILVCTPSWIAQLCEERGFIIGRHHLVVNRYDWRYIEATLKSLIENSSGDSWSQVASKLAQLGHWEFDEYHDAPTAKTSSIGDGDAGPRTRTV